ncbi:MAG: glycoside hydrolase, partial [Kiritimatiellaceae bacterium]
MMNLFKGSLILLVGWVGIGGAFPALIPEEKPAVRVSPAVERLYDEWNPYEDRANDLYSNFKYTPLIGLPEGDELSRRDPTKVLLIDGVYHVWYTGRKHVGIPVGPKQASAQRASFDWDLCDIWHATSEDGWTWK